MRCCYGWKKQARPHYEKPSDMGPPRKFYTLNERGFEELAAFGQNGIF